MDGGVNRETAEYAGSLGADVLVVGSALFRKGADAGPRDPARPEPRRGGLRPRVPRRPAARREGPLGPGDDAARATSAPRSCRTLEGDGIPVIFLRGEGPVDPDGVREYDVLVPVAADPIVRRAPLPRRSPPRRRPAAEARALMRALLQRVSRAEVRVDGEVVGSRPARAPRPARHRARRRRCHRASRSHARSRSSGSSTTRTAGRTSRSLDVGGGALVVSQFTLYADTRRGRRPGLHGRRAAGRGRSRSTSVFAEALAALGSGGGHGPVRRRDGGRARQRRPVHDLAGHRGPLRPNDPACPREAGVGRRRRGSGGSTRRREVAGRRRGPAGPGSGALGGGAPAPGADEPLDRLAPSTTTSFWRFGW